MEDLEKKVMELEQQLLGILFQDTGNSYWGLIEGQRWYSEKHQEIYEDLKKNTNFRYLDYIEQTIPDVSVKEENLEYLLKCKDTIRYLEMIDYTPFFLEWKQGLFDLRAQKVGWKIVHEGYSSEVQTALRQIEIDLAQEKAIEIVKVGEGIERLVEGLNQTQEAPQIEDIHFRDINDVLVTPPGTLITIGARTSVGKSSLMLNLAIDYGRKYRVLYISTEMNTEALLKRLIVNGARIDASKVFSYKVDTEFWNEALQKFYRMGLHKLQMVLAYTPGISTIMIESLVQQYKPEVVFVDFIQQMRCMTEQKYLMRYQELGMIISQLKDLAGKRNLIMYVASQLSRAADAPGIEEPSLIFLRESGNLEEFSDIVILLYYEKDKRGKKIQSPVGTNMILDVQKNRNGRRAKVKMVFVEKFLRFERVEEKEVRKDE